MKFFTVYLSEPLKEELYADINPDFIPFVLLEAVVNMVNDLPIGIHPDLPLDTEFDNTDNVYLTSVMSLVNIMVSADNNSGTDTTTEDYENNIEDYGQYVQDRLAIATHAIKQAPMADMNHLVTITSEINMAERNGGFSFSATHLPIGVLYTYENVRSIT